MDKQLFLSTAKSYIESGFNVTYVHREHKYPIGASWRHLINKQVTMTELESMTSITSDEDRNIGIITGKTSGIIVVDIDDDDAYMELEKAGITLPETLTVTSSRGSHYYYKYIEGTSVKTVAGILPHVDIRADGGLIVAPPSVHASGATYKWSKELPIADLPSGILELAKKALEREVKNTIAVGKGERLVDMLKDGRRNATLTTYAGKLRNLGLNEETILQTLLMENRLSSNPLGEDEVRIVTDSVSKYQYSDNAYELNDLGNAYRFVDYAKDRVLFDRDRGKWITYNGITWEYNQAERMVMDKLTARFNLIPMEIDVNTEDDEEIAELYTKWSKTSKSKAKIDATLDLSKRYMATSDDAFDANHALFNCQNVCLNLNTGKVFAHSPNLMTRKVSNVIYDPKATAPRWEQFLEEIFLGDKELVKWVQKAIGYSMTGETTEEVFFLLHGTGSNGKSKFLDVLQYILGSYTETAEFSAFKLKTNDGVNNDIARLVGSRMVLASESNKGVRLNEALVKKLTGEEQMTARFLYQDYFTFNITFKIWLATNYLPSIYDDTDGTWRRIKIIPFKAAFKGAKADRNLLSKLKAEGSGILNWCLEGHALWKSEGLGTCASVEYQTSEYRGDMDAISEFIDDMCVEDEEDKVLSSTLYDAYKEWCNKESQFTERKSDFKNALDRRGIPRIKISNYYFKGLRLKSPSDLLSDEAKEMKTRKTKTRKVGTDY